MSALISSALRTAFGRLSGTLAGERPYDLAALLIEQALARASALDPARIDEVL